MKQIGISYQSRPIYALEIKKEKAGTVKPAIYVDSLIHCREWISTASLMFLFKEVSWEIPFQKSASSCTLFYPIYGHMVIHAFS